MRIRFFSRLSLIVLAAFLVVASQVWTGGTLEWVTFGAGILTAAIAAADSVRTGEAQRTIDGVLVVGGAFTVVASFVFTGSTLLWLAFGLALAIGALAVAGLVYHEMTTERVVHELSVAPERTPAIAAERTSAAAA